MYEVVMEMNQRQVAVDQRVDTIEESLKSLQVSQPATGGCRPGRRYHRGESQESTGESTSGKNLSVVDPNSRF